MTAFIIFVILNIMAALSGSIFSPGDWYKSLNKPSWQPADWVFPTVWTVLYLMNAFAGWLVWEAMGTLGLGWWAMAIYGIGLLLNSAWSAIFFGLKRMGFAMIEVGLLWIAIVLQGIIFFQIVPLAGILVIPYVFWVSIAAFLNFTVWRLNPEAPEPAI